MKTSQKKTSKVKTDQTLIEESKAANAKAHEALQALRDRREEIGRAIDNSVSSLNDAMQGAPLRGAISVR